MTENISRTPQEPEAGLFDHQPVQYAEKDGVLDVYAGSPFLPTLKKAISLAKERERSISFDFNGVNINVMGDSVPRLVQRDWRRALHEYIDPNIGPYPKVELSPEELANDARIEAENRARRQAEDYKRREQERIHRERVEAKLKDAPGIELADEAAWQMYQDRNTDFYGAGVISYSERWARLMQLEIAQGKSLPEIAEATSHEADIDGITGSMYGAAVSTLVNTWAHGEELRKWRKT